MIHQQVGAESSVCSSKVSLDAYISPLLGTGLSNISTHAHTTGVDRRQAMEVIRPGDGAPKRNDHEPQPEDDSRWCVICRHRIERIKTDTWRHIDD